MTSVSEKEKPDRLVNGRSAQALRLAETAIRRNRLRPERGATYESMTANLARVLMRTHPKSQHGQLLMRALSPASPQKRSEPENAVRWLIKRGQSPTPEAVADRLQIVQAQKAPKIDIWDIAESIAARDGMRAAQTIAEQIAETGQAPTWFELARALDWPRKQTRFDPIFRLLEREGWIVTGPEPRSIRPGRRYQETEKDK